MKKWVAALLTLCLLVPGCFLSAAAESPAPDQQPKQEALPAGNCLLAIIDGERILFTQESAYLATSGGSGRGVFEGTGVKSAVSGSGPEIMKIGYVAKNPRGQLRYRLALHIPASAAMGSIYEMDENTPKEIDPEQPQQAVDRLSVFIQLDNLTDKISYNAYMGHYAEFAYRIEITSRDEGWMTYEGKMDATLAYSEKAKALVQGAAFRFTLAK